MKVTINRGEPRHRMGCTSVPFNVNLGEKGFEKFLSILPDGHRAYYTGRCSDVGPTTVEIMFPEEISSQIDPESGEALRTMCNLAESENLTTQRHILNTIARSMA